MIGRQPLTRWVDGVHTVCGTADTESAASTRRPHRGPALEVHGGDEKGREGTSRHVMGRRSVTPLAVGHCGHGVGFIKISCTSGGHGYGPLHHRRRGLRCERRCCLSTQNGNGVCDDCVDRDVRAASDGGPLQSHGFVSFDSPRPHDSLSTQHGRLRHRSATTKAFSDGVHAGCGEHRVGFIEESIESDEASDSAGLWC